MVIFWEEGEYNYLQGHRNWCEDSSPQDGEERAAFSKMIYETWAELARNLLGANHLGRN